MATGLIQCATVAYLSEVSPAHIRGASLAGYQLAVSDLQYTQILDRRTHIKISLGEFIAMCLGQLVVASSPSSYRRLLLCQTAMLG